MWKTLKNVFYSWDLHHLWSTNQWKKWFDVKIYQSVQWAGTELTSVRYLNAPFEVLRTQPRIALLSESCVDKPVMFFHYCYFPLAQQVMPHFFGDQTPTCAEGFVFMLQRHAARGQSSGADGGADGGSHDVNRNPTETHAQGAQVNVWPSYTNI